MTLRVTRLDETNRPAFEALLGLAWGQNWGAGLARDLIRWRYDDRPAGDTWLALDDGQCVAMLDAFLRPYLFEGRRILVREGCDWYCLPKYRPLGVGLRLMRAMMAAPEPMLAVGGSEATVSILPRLQWSRLADVRRYVLPVKVRGLAAAFLRGWWPAGEVCARAIPGFIPTRSSRPAPRGGPGRVAEWAPGSPAPLPVPHGRGLVQVLEPVDLNWLARMPAGVAQALGLVFYLGEEAVGFSLAQIEPAPAGLDGRIVHLQVRDADLEFLAWVVAETAARLAARGVSVIRCLASSPEKDAALRRAGFLVRGAMPSYWWPKAGMAASADADLGYLRADDAVPFAALIGRHGARPWRLRPAAGSAPTRWAQDRTAGRAPPRRAAPGV